MLARIVQIVVKELIELRRDRWARFRLVVPALLQLFVFGYAATFEVSGVSTAVLDLDHSQESRELLSRFTYSQRFHVVIEARSQRRIDDAIDRSDAVIALVIHPGFAALLQKGQTAPLQVIVDGTNSNSALIALGYVAEIAQGFAADYVRIQVERLGPAVAARPIEIGVARRPWFNPDLNSRWYFVPGIIATLTLVMVVNLTAFAVVREREVGTLEQIMVTPIRPLEFIIGKTVPSFLIGLGLVLLVSLVGILWFGIPFRGNPLIMLFGTSLYLLSTLALGLLISTICATQQQAFATTFFVVNPLFTLSGFAFPVASMPTMLQWATYANPVRYFLVIIRAVFLKGVGLAVLWPEFLALALIALALLGASVLRFRKSLD